MEQLQIAINPPPDDRACECCGIGPKELAPFGGAGDPLVGDFKGAVLVKIFRPLAPEPTPEQMEKAIANVLKAHPDWERGDAAESVGQFSNSIGASWECRDCILLDDEAYWKKRLESKSQSAA